MVLPSRLPEGALTILRQLARSTARRTGSSLPFASIGPGKGCSPGDLESGLADLLAAGLVRVSDEAGREVIVTEEGEAFFARFFLSCH